MAVYLRVPSFCGGLLVVSGAASARRDGGKLPVAGGSKWPEPASKPHPVHASRQLVGIQNGPALAWHLDKPDTHEQRSLTDLRLIEALAPDCKILELGPAPAT